MNRLSSFVWRPQTKYFVIGGFVILLVALVATYIVNNLIPTTTFRMGSGIYRLRIADTNNERIQGLSGVEHLNSDSGLLMKFDSDDKWGIWMRDMNIPLDIVWLDKNKKIVYIVKNASPELSTDVVFTPQSNARYVVELRAGSIEEAGIEVGIVAKFDENDRGGIQ